MMLFWEGILDLHAEQEKVDDLKRRCRKNGRELVTPLAIATLFDISGAAIRMARKHGFIKPYVKLSVTGKAVDLTLLDTALRYWKNPPADLDYKLTEYRRNGTALAVDSEFFNVLHSEKNRDAPVSPTTSASGVCGRGQAARIADPIGTVEW